MPRVSICIPTYRQIDYLRATLASIQDQAYKDYEVIVSDDSPDDSVERLVASFDFGGKLSYCRNAVALGSPKNWNVAIGKATGDYIKLLHHDDRFTHPDALGAFVQMLDAHPEADFAFGASLVESSVSGESRIHRATNKQLELLASQPESLFFGNIIGAPSATIYRNGLCIEYDQRMKWLVDIDFYIRVLQRNPRFINSAEALIATATEADHQVTKICQDNVEADFFEHVLLYKKVSNKLRNSVTIQRVWFRLFEKYQIYSRADMSSLGDQLELQDYECLNQIFSEYRKKWLQRLPYRLYARLPISIKSILRSLRNFGK